MSARQGTSNYTVHTAFDGWNRNRVQLSSVDAGLHTSHSMWTNQKQDCCIRTITTGKNMK